MKSIFDGFWSILGGKMEASWHPNGGAKTHITSKDDFSKNRAPVAAGARFLRFWGSKLGVQID